MQKLAEEYINSIVKCYEDARNVFSKNKDELVFRGRSHSVSSNVEDITALLLYHILKSEEDLIEIYIDQCITYKEEVTNNKAKSFYPDILICVKRSEIRHCIYMCDLKMDPGWNRNGLPDLTKKHSGHIQILQDNKIIKSSKNGITKQSINLTFENCSSYDTVYITDQNGSDKFKMDYESLKDCQISRPFVLFSGSHPNEYSEELTINVTEDFDSWINRIKSFLNNFKEQN